MIFFTYFWSLLGGILLFLALSHIIYQNRSPRSMIAWILFIIFLPHIAAPLYFIIGIRKRDSSYTKTDIEFLHPTELDEYHQDIEQNAIAKLLYNNDIPPSSKNNYFQLISDDREAFSTMLSEIEAAKESIDISTYVFKFDDTTQKILDRLIQKQKDGVKVRILIDLVGSFGTFLKKKEFREFKSVGGEVLFFAPILKRPFQNYINLRNHRKIYLFDQKRVLSGGMNLSDEYMGEDNNTKRWRDLLYLLEGATVHNFYTIFENDWAYAKIKKPQINFRTSQKHKGKSVLQVVPSGPDIPNDGLYKAILEAIYSAKVRIWITTPYFVPDENILIALEVASNKGVDLRLITPKISNHLIADLSRSSYIRELSKIGAEIYFYEGEMLHAKAMIFDNTTAIVGSLNLDNRSLFLNYEIVSFLYTKEDIDKLSDWKSDLIANSSHELQEASKIQQAFENIIKVISPMI